MRNLFYCLVVVLVSFCGAYPQERIIDEVSYNKTIQMANSFLNKESFRTRTIVEICDGPNCIWKTIERSNTEVEGPDKRRHFGEVVSPRGFENLPEYRFIGDKVYRKQTGEDWKVEQREPPSTPEATRSEGVFAFRELGTEKEGVKEFRVLMRTANVRLLVKGSEHENVQITKSWLDGTGRYRKQEYLWTDSRRTTRRTIYYETDPSIKIETPIK